MGYDPNFVALMQNEIALLKARILVLEQNNAPRQQIIQEGVNTEKETANVVGNAIESAYELIESTLEDLRHRPVTPAINTQINNLIALKAEVPLHFTVSLGDQEWLNEQINTILGNNSSS